MQMICNFLKARPAVRIGSTAEAHDRDLPVGMCQQQAAAPNDFVIRMGHNYGNFPLRWRFGFEIIQFGSLSIFQRLNSSIAWYSAISGLSLAAYRLLRLGHTGQKRGSRWIEMD
jgi:hypothetical protein